ncbi:MAG TPA: TetR/AcrR family transcriptional regulator [Prolixibacteraceae bacterium]|nr:TetR/AcrR family transcriptional regulator [Prolixibacteraceae bacterium]
MEIREKIMRTAGRLFIENGVKQITMDAISKSIGASKRTVYENFKDKNDLLYNVLTEGIISNKKEALKIIETSANVIEALFLIGNFHQKMYGSINPLFFIDIKKYHSQVFDKVLKSDQFRNYEITYTLLKRGVNEGIFRKEINIEIVNLFIHHTLDFFPKYEDQIECSLALVSEWVHLPYLRGLCTDKGNEMLKKIYEEYKNS